MVAFLFTLSPADTTTTTFGTRTRRDVYTIVLLVHAAPPLGVMNIQFHTGFFMSRTETPVPSAACVRTVHTQRIHMTLNFRLFLRTYGHVWVAF